MRDRLSAIRQHGAELVIIGNGSERFASAFREDLDLDVPLLVDPDLGAYRAAGLRRGRVEILSPRLPIHALRALLRGARQHGVQGDAWQLGGVFVIRPDGRLTFRHSSREAGDHARLGDVLAALAPGARPIAETEAPSTAQQWLGRGLGAVMDPTIALSFGAPGFVVHSLNFEADDLDVSLSGKRCLITGANSGIGYEAALALADLGATVVLLCRSYDRGREVAEKIVETTGNASVSVERLDLADLDSVRKAAGRLASQTVDVLIHNAGLLPEKKIETVDGLELTVSTHVVGPFLLTRLLRGALESSPDGRIVWVSSGGMYTQRLGALDELIGADGDRPRPYDGVRAYAETKRAQVVLSELWAEELRGTSVVCNSMHPGWVDTPGVRTSLPSFFRVMRSILRTPAQGADTIVWLAASERAAGATGLFFFDRRPRRTHLLPGTRESEADRRRLWQFCEEHALAPGEASTSSTAPERSAGVSP